METFYEAGDISIRGIHIKDVIIFPVFIFHGGDILMPHPHSCPLLLFCLYYQLADAALNIS